MRKASRKFTATLSVPGIANGTDTTFTLSSVVGLPTDTMVDLTIDRVDSSGVLTPAKEEVITGMVSGSNIINAIRGVEGTAQAHASGAVVEVRLTASQWNDTIDEIIRLRNAPQGFMLDGKIVPSVSGNNLTVALKNKFTGTDPSALNPVRIMIGDTPKTITYPVSFTVNAGQNYLNMGSSELATKTVGLFPKLVWNTNTGAVSLIVARIPFGNIISEYTDSLTGEKGYLYSGTKPASTDLVENVGYFEATLSAGAGYTWSVPTFTSENLIQRPIFETRLLDYAVGVDQWVNPPSSQTRVGKYKITGSSITHIITITGSQNASNSSTLVVLTDVFTVNQAIGASGGKRPSSGNFVWSDNASFDEGSSLRVHVADTGNYIYIQFPTNTRRPTMLFGQISYEI